MRRHFAYPALMALLLATALAGCQQEPLPESGDAIRFSVQPADISIETKAKPTSWSYLNTVGNKIKLYGTYTDGTTPTTLFDGSVPLMCTEVTDSPQSATWSYVTATTPTKYWDKRYSYQFSAAFPSTADITSGSGLVVAYDMSKGEVSGVKKGSYDLMVASTASINAASRESNTVNLPFYHACAALRFKFQEGPGVTGTPAYDYYIRSFEIQGVYTEKNLEYSHTGVVDVSDWKVPEGGAVATLSYYSDETGKQVPENGHSAYLFGTEWYYAIPQALQNGAVIHFTYVIDGHESEVFDVNLPINTYSENPVTWAPAQLYTYIITIQPDFISLSVSFDDWENGGSWDLTD